MPSTACFRRVKPHEESGCAGDHCRGGWCSASARDGGSSHAPASHWGACETCWSPSGRPGRPSLYCTGACHLLPLMAALPRCRADSLLYCRPLPPLEALPGCSDACLLDSSCQAFRHGWWTACMASAPADRGEMVVRMAGTCSPMHTDLLCQATQLWPQCNQACSALSAGITLEVPREMFFP